MAPERRNKSAPAASEGPQTRSRTTHNTTSTGSKRRKASSGYGAFMTDREKQKLVNGWYERAGKGPSRPADPEGYVRASSRLRRQPERLGVLVPKTMASLLRNRADLRERTEQPSAPQRKATKSQGQQSERASGQGGRQDRRKASAPYARSPQATASQSGNPGLANTLQPGARRTKGQVVGAQSQQSTGKQASSSRTPLGEKTNRQRSPSNADLASGPSAGQPPAGHVSSSPAAPASPAARSDPASPSPSLHSVHFSDRLGPSSSPVPPPKPRILHPPDYGVSCLIEEAEAFLQAANDGTGRARENLNTAAIFLDEVVEVDTCVRVGKFALRMGHQGIVRSAIRRAGGINDLDPAYLDLCANSSLCKALHRLVAGDRETARDMLMDAAGFARRGCELYAQEGRVSQTTIDSLAETWRSMAVLARLNLLKP